MMERALDSLRVATLPLSWWLTWHHGPDAGARQRLHVGRHVVGRGAPVHDPALAPHHALFEVSPDGTLTVTWLRGVAHQRRQSGPQVIESGAWLELGDSLVQCTLASRDARTAHDTAHIRDGALIRTPRVPSVWSPPSGLDDPNLRPGGHGAQSGHGAHGLVPAALALAGAGLMALVMRQPMFLMFGLVGALVAVGTWVAQRIVVARGRRRTRRLLEQSAREFAEQHRRSVHTLVRACAAARHRGASLWSRRATHHDAFLVSPGSGDVPLPGPLCVPGLAGASGLVGASGVLSDVAYGIDLGPGARVAIRGPRAHAVARALVVQLATSCGPADLCIALDVTPDTPDTPYTPLGGAWSSLLDLPHLEQGAAPHTIHVTDRPDQLALRTSPLRRALADTTRRALLVVLADDDPVPHLCTHVCTTTDGPWGEWRVTGATIAGSITRLRIAGLGEQATAECAAALSGLRDPEDPRAADDALPSTVDLATLLGPHLQRRLDHAGAEGHSPRTPIGVASDGVVDLDLVRDGPHALIAGTTGSGKSQLLRSMVLGMAARSAPQHLQFVLVDYKGGATFDDLAALPHVVGVVTDLDAHLADRVLRSLHAELRRREAVLRQYRVADLEALYAVEHLPATVTMARLVVIVDEFAALVHEQSDFLHALLGIAQRGRSLGVHLVLATQRPHGVISDDIRANTNLRLALRLHDTADAIDVVGIADPTTLPRQRPGRAVLRLGTDEYVTFQAATCDAPSMVRAICDALTRAGGHVGHIHSPPWLPPLPEVLRAHDTTDGAVGLVDDPDHQARHLLRWSPADGNLLVVGSPGSGTSTTLTTLVQHTLALGTHHVYLLTDGAADPGTEPHVVVVNAHDTELVARLLHRVARQVNAHSVHPNTTRTPPVLLVVDTIEGVRGALDHPSTLDELDALDALLAHPDPPLVVVAATARPMAVPSALLARCSNRWVHHLHDAHDAVHLGMRAADVPPAVPGRAHVVPLGLTAQVSLPGCPSGASALEPPEPIRPIPAQVHPCELEPRTLEHGAPGHGAIGHGAIGHGALEQAHELAIGRSVVSGSTRSLELYPGEHLTVLGGARTGRTTALVRIATAWREAHPDGVVEVVAPRRTRTGPADIALRALQTSASPDSPSPTAASIAHDASVHPRLVVVDDAELVDNLDLGSTGSSLIPPDQHTSIVIAARPDALRQQYGHWSATIRRSRNGLIAASGTDLDGDLLGTMLPRRMPLAARPGLMWCVTDGTTELVQVAADNLAGHGVRLAPR